MVKTKISTEWDLLVTTRYTRQNMERAMSGRIERGLVELITNADDSYRDLEESGKKGSGKIRIEILRRRSKPSFVIVKDRASGMSREQLREKIGTLGRRTSGFENGKLRRGLQGRGAKDVAAFGIVHFESIKDGEYNHLLIQHNLKCKFFNERPKKTTSDIRKRLGIMNGNGLVVTIEVDNQFSIPLHETLCKDLSRYYSLRDIFSDPDRIITLIDNSSNKEDRLIYRYPKGEKIFDKEILITKYPNANAQLKIYKHDNPFEQDYLSSCREGILVKSSAAIHECTYFGLDSDAFSWRFNGELKCDYIDKLIKEFDDIEENNPNNPVHSKENPYSLLDPFREGLRPDHPFRQSLYKESKKVLANFIDELKKIEESQKRSVTNESLDKKLSKLSKEISKLFEKKIIDIDEELISGSIDDSYIKKINNGLYIIPDELSIIINQPKVFTVVVKDNKVLDKSIPIKVISDNPKSVEVLDSTVLFKKILEDGKVGKTTFAVIGKKLGAEVLVEAKYGDYSNVTILKVKESPDMIEIPIGLSFEKPKYNIIFGKEKNLALRLKTNPPIESVFIAELFSTHSEIVIKGNHKCKLVPNKSLKYSSGSFRVVGRQLNAKGLISAKVKGLELANTGISVIEKEKSSGIKLRFEPVEDDFGTVRFKWDNKDPRYCQMLWMRVHISSNSSLCSHLLR